METIILYYIVCSFLVSLFLSPLSKPYFERELDLIYCIFNNVKYRNLEYWSSVCRAELTLFASHHADDHDVGLCDKSPYAHPQRNTERQQQEGDPQ